MTYSAHLIGLLFLGATVQSQRSNDIECIYRRLDVPAIIASVQGRQSENPASEANKVARDRFIREANLCRNSNNWSEKQTKFAINYASGRAAFESATQRLKDAGIGHDLIGEIISKLTSEQRKRVVAGDFEILRPAAEPILERYILGRFTEERARSLSRAAGEGVMGFLLQADALEQFRP